MWRRRLKNFLLWFPPLVLLGYCVVIFTGPGANDFTKRIKNNYFYNDSGGHEKNIIYRGQERRQGIVIGARVYQYRLVEDKLYVARIPRLVEWEEGDTLRPKSRLSGGCEIWQINIETHEKKNITSTDTSIVSCKKN